LPPLNLSEKKLYHYHIPLENNYWLQLGMIKRGAYQMKSKERWLTALNLGKPDRVPATVHSWQQYHLDKYLNGIDELAAYKTVGLDPEIHYYEEMGQFWIPGLRKNKKYSDEWIDEVTILNSSNGRIKQKHLITTPKGKLTFATEGDAKTTWITEYMIKEHEDIEKIRYLPVPKIDKKNVEKEYSRIGDDGVFRGFVFGDQAGCWQHLACYMDITDLILASIDTPAWTHEALNILLGKKLRFIYESLKNAKFDIIETGGGSSSSTVISPSLFKEFCLPYDQKINDALHDVNHKSTYHTCGGMYGILDDIIDMNTDMSETLSNKGLGGNTDGPEIYEKMHGKVCMNGGLDQINILTKGTPEDVRKEVFRIFEIYGSGGGYIMSCCDHFFEAPLENIRAYASAASECSY